MTDILPVEIWVQILEEVIANDSTTRLCVANGNAARAARTCNLFAQIINPWLRGRLDQTVQSVELLSRAFPTYCPEMMAGHVDLLMHTAQVLPTLDSSVAFLNLSHWGSHTAMLILTCAYSALHAAHEVHVVVSPAPFELVMEEFCSAFTSMGVLWKKFSGGGIELMNNTVIYVATSLSCLTNTTPANLLVIPKSSQSRIWPPLTYQRTVSFAVWELSIQDIHAECGAPRPGWASMDVDQEDHPWNTLKCAHCCYSPKGARCFHVAKQRLYNCNERTERTRYLIEFAMRVSPSLIIT